MSYWPDLHKISSICSGNIFANPAIFILTEFLFLLKILMVSTNFSAIPRIFAQNIDCGYTLEPPQRRFQRVPTIYVLDQK